MMDFATLQAKYGVPYITNYGFLKFRCHSLNLLLGGNGLPMNKFIEIYGAESSGKTTLGLELLGEAAKNNCIPFISDQEKQIDDNRIAKFGLFRGKNCVVTRAHYIEELFDWLDTFVEALRKAKDNRPIVGLIDSVGVMIPKAVYDLTDTTEAGNPGTTAKAWGNQLKRWMAKQNDCNITLIFLNHENAVFMQPGSKPIFGAPPPTTTPGGKTFKHLMHARLQITKGAMIKQDEEKIGNFVYVRTVKTRDAPPFQSVQLPLYFGNPLLPADRDFAGTHDGLAALYHLKDIDGAIHVSGSKSRMNLLGFNNAPMEVSWSGPEQWLEIFEKMKPFVYNTMTAWHYNATKFHIEYMKNNPQIAAVEEAE